MKFIIIGLCALATGAYSSLLFPSPPEWQPTVSREGKEIRRAIYTQWADHFDQNDLRTFEQTVYINEQYYYPGGPVLIFVSATMDAYAYWLENSHMASIADQLGAVIYALEPRYYGTSFPTPDVALTNLEKYLQINQTMADYFGFITFLRQELIAFGSDKFVLIGHGRGGTLATWLHQSNPGLADGLWAISSPTSISFDFALYYYGMNLTFEEYFPDQCQQTIREGFAELEVLVENRDFESIRQIFILESNNVFDLANPHDVALFYYQLFETLFSPVEYGVASTINVICDQLQPSDVLSSLELLGLFYGFSLYDRVFQYETYVAILRDESLNAQQRIGAHVRQDLYTSCAGWALFRVSTILPSPINERFSSNLFGDLCNDVFGITLSNAIQNNDRTNVANQLNPSISNAYFTNAGFDPHRLIGVQNDLNPTSPHDLIPGIGKLYDFMRSVEPDYNSAELEAVRNRAAQLLTSWTSPSVQ